MSGCGGAGSFAKPLSLLLCNEALVTPFRDFGLFDGACKEPLKITRWLEARALESLYLLGEICSGRHGLALFYVRWAACRRKAMRLWNMILFGRIWCRHNWRWNGGRQSWRWAGFRATDYAARYSTELLRLSVHYCITKHASRWYFLVICIQFGRNWLIDDGTL